MTSLRDLDQIVIDPEDRSDQLLEAVYRLAEADPPLIDTKTKVYLWVRLMLHPLVHTFVRMKRYDKASHRLIDTGWRVCMYCSKATTQ